MLDKILSNSKSGAASFYVVAFSTLILIIVATSFATAIVAELNRTSNADLAQSAYDSALAGVGDARMAFTNYQNCINSTKEGIDKNEGSLNEMNSDNSVNTCNKIIYFVAHPDEISDNYNACDMTSRILGRNNGEGGEVPVDEVKDTSSSNNLDQAYTCVKFKTKLEDYRATLTSEHPYKLVKVDLADGVRASDVKYVKLSWYFNDDNKRFNYTNFLSINNGLSNNNRVTFQPANATNLSTPPTISLQLIQSGDNNLTMDYLTSMTKNVENAGTGISGLSTDRATAYFVPTNDLNSAKQKAVNNTINSKPATYDGAYDEDKEINMISAEKFASTNDHAKDLPFLTYCDNAGEYNCSVTVELPNAFGGNRASNTFMFIVSLPYGQPETDFSMEFMKGIDEKPVQLDNMQVLVDSTGRANDLYRRVEVRLEPAENIFDYPFYAIQTKDIKKDIIVTQEHQEYPEPEPDTPTPPDPPTPPVPPTPPDPPTPPSTKLYMWDAKLSDCGKVMWDNRDGVERSYTTALINGLCWMTQSLDLAGGTTLTPQYSNVQKNYTLPRSSSFGFNDDNTAYVYNTNNNRCSSTSTPIPCHSYYSFKAAVAGATYRNSGNINQDICPKNWRLPTKENYRSLTNKSGPNLISSPWYGDYGGYFTNSRFVSEGHNIAWYWTSSMSYVSDPYGVVGWEAYVAGVFNYGPERTGQIAMSRIWYGDAVRCVLK